MKGKGSPVLILPQTSWVLVILEDYFPLRRYSWHCLDPSLLYLATGPETDIAPS